MTEEHDHANTDATMSRRTAIGAAGVAAAGFASGGQAAESEVGQECMTIIYENGDDVHFDFDYYRSTHMPLIMRLYGNSISRFVLRRGLPGADGAPPPYVATLNIYIADVDAFEAAAAEHQAGIRADVDKFTNATLIAQRDRVVAIAES